MTIKDYIRDKIQSFGIFQVSEASLLDISEANSLVLDNDATTYTVKQRETAIIRFTPELLLSLDSISENGFSVSRANTESRIKSYVAAKCKELGIEDTLNAKSVISSKARW